METAEDILTRDLTNISEYFEKWRLLPSTAKTEESLEGTNQTCLHNSMTWSHSNHTVDDLSAHHLDEELRSSAVVTASICQVFWENSDAQLSPPTHVLPEASATKSCGSGIHQHPLLKRPKKNYKQCLFISGHCMSHGL
nr:unnamed protein product [Callosobruchus chinensis]